MSVTMVRVALANYGCHIVECVAEGDRACARMEFSGVHVAPFRGFEPTGKIVRWRVLRCSASRRASSPRSGFSAI